MSTATQSLLALIVLSSLAGSHGEPAEKPKMLNSRNVHSYNAKVAADVAEQAATVAKRVASHTAQVARDTAAALRYTQDALRKARASGADVADLGKQAEKLESEVGISSSQESEHKTSQGKQSSHESQHKISNTIGNIGKNMVQPFPDNGARPFGQEHVGRKLTKKSIKESDSMIDQIERAQGAESKRAVNRALTHLRGATIAAYDGMAKSHMANVDAYHKAHKWRKEHPIKHLAEEEADTDKWAFRNLVQKEEEEDEEDEKDDEDEMDEEAEESFLEEDGEEENDEEDEEDDEGERRRGQ